jgi:hypothetical protein
MGESGMAKSRRGKRTGETSKKPKGCKAFLLSAMTRDFEIAGIVNYIRKTQTLFCFRGEATLSLRHPTLAWIAGSLDH